MRTTQLLRLLIASVLAALALAPAAAQTPDLGVLTSDDGIPVLVKHLPDWEQTRARSVYTRKAAELSAAVPGQPVLEVVTFDGATEAVTADYGTAGRLVVVEFATPQMAADSDARITQRVNELRAAGQNVPAVYRRVGNYSVFVFGAADAQAAELLAGKVRYEKNVRWLGHDPYANERANRRWINMSASVLVNTVKAAGLAVVACLCVGLCIGAVIFRRRRTALGTSYSDAGGMMRLNLDEHAAKLLGPDPK